MRRLEGAVHHLSPPVDVPVHSGTLSRAPSSLHSLTNFFTDGVAVFFPFNVVRTRRGAILRIDLRLDWNDPRFVIRRRPFIVPPTKSGHIPVGGCYVLERNRL